MICGTDAARSAWRDALAAAALFAIDPHAAGGVLLHGSPGPVRERWLEILTRLLPAGSPVRRIPAHVGDGRLLGGLDLAATLRAGRPIAERGLLAEGDGGVLVLPMAERASPGTAVRIGQALDHGEIALERDGLTLRWPARFGLVALDESHEGEEIAPPRALLDRLAFRVAVEGVPLREVVDSELSREEVAAARDRSSRVSVTDDVIEALAASAEALGIASLRGLLFATRVARSAAALGGRRRVEEEDAALAARLIFSWRAMRLPRPDENADPDPPPIPRNAAPEEAGDPPAQETLPLEDLLLEAARAAIPPGLLAQLRAGVRPRLRARAPGRAGFAQHSQLRGRPAGTRRGELGRGARLDVVETLRAAAPWQPLRRREREGRGARQSARIEVRREDFRVTRFKQRTQSTTIFVVDASGSTALHRLAEAKGAVELLLADCYVRRDHVALIAFRGRGAELLLPPTRSLVRAKRSLAQLPGGGGTPLAAGLDAAATLAAAVARRDETPTIVLLTDGRANVARDGRGGREAAEADAISAARSLAARGLSAVLIDTAPRPQPRAQALAREMQGRYLALPHADARVLAAAARAGAVAQPRPGR
jgi:magnesium chelatase subunit D